MIGKDEPTTVHQPLFVCWAFASLLLSFDSRTQDEKVHLPIKIYVVDFWDVYSAKD